MVFDEFRPPYDEGRGVPVGDMSLVTTSGVPIGPEALDRDPATAWIAKEGLGRGSGLALSLRHARRLSAVVLLVDLEDSPLAVPWIASVGGEIMAEGPIRAGFQWVGGTMRAGRQALLVIPLADREAEQVRLVFQGPGPRLSIAGPITTRIVPARLRKPRRGQKLPALWATGTTGQPVALANTAPPSL